MVKLGIDSLEERHIIGIVAVLTEDLKLSKKYLQQKDTQSHRRIYVRTAISYVECIVFLTKFNAYDRAKALNLKFTMAEIAMMLEESYELQRGQAVSRPYFAKSHDIIKFAFNVCSRAYGCELQPDYGDHRWDSLQKAFDVRNRITHPKTENSLIISDEDLRLVLEGLDWFADITIKLQLYIQEILKREYTDLLNHKTET